MSDQSAQEFLRELDRTLWAAADRLRANLDAAVYRHAVLGLVFLKYVLEYGQESNTTTWRLAAMNMAIRGIDFNFGKEPANSFTQDQHPDLRAERPTRRMEGRQTNRVLFDFSAGVSNAPCGVCTRPHRACEPASSASSSYRMAGGIGKYRSEKSCPKVTQISADGKRPVCPEYAINEPPA